MGARYSRTSGYTISRRTASTRPTVRTVQRKVALGPVAAKLVGLGVLAVLAILMLTSSGRSSTSLYDQNKMRQEISEINRDTEQLKLEAKRAQSLQEIQQTAVKQQMVPADDVEFIEKGDVAGASTAAP
ncbi:MAG TPA: hypothetical protein VLA04_00845 [Verrucomicrobiae bacterium]|nr:hypothetical protein [Verrucomicrobiae bacterium]